jgi:hypothetical protein
MSSHAEASNDDKAGALRQMAADGATFAMIAAGERARLRGAGAAAIWEAMVAAGIAQMEHSELVA